MRTFFVEVIDMKRKVYSFAAITAVAVVGIALFLFTPVFSFS